MKYSKNTINLIKSMQSLGLSSRKIAMQLDISKSGVNDLFKRKATLLCEQEAEDSKGKQPRILIFDLETAAATALTFGRFKVNLSQANILENGGWILCACWRWLGQEEVESLWLSPQEVAECDDSRLVERLFELYEEADAVLAHNSLGFDHKVLQARAIYNGFPALPLVKVLDTLQLARRYLKLPSNRLDAIGEFFGLGRKIDTGGISLWKEVQSGDKEAMAKMLEYCKQDVNLLYEVYLRTRHLGRAGSDFNAALYYEDDKVRCRVCGSTDVYETGRTTETALNSFAEVRCNSCGAVHRHRQAKTTKEKRKNLLM
jgi:DNA polymerase elongation subunit (family B)